MLRMTVPREPVAGVNAVKANAGVNVVPFADPKPATSSSAGCVVVMFGVLGAFELPVVPALVSTRFAEAMPTKSDALTSLVEDRLLENVTVILSPAWRPV